VVLITKYIWTHIGTLNLHYFKRQLISFVTCILQAYSWLSIIYSRHSMSSFLLACFTRFLDRFVNQKIRRVQNLKILRWTVWLELWWILYWLSEFFRFSLIIIDRNAELLRDLKRRHFYNYQVSKLLPPSQIICHHFFYVRMYIDTFLVLIHVYLYKDETTNLR
jgi:hypothetical protein